MSTVCRCLDMAEQAGALVPSPFGNILQWTYLPLLQRSALDIDSHSHSAGSKPTTASSGPRPCHEYLALKLRAG
jgi:hypothetical protein